MSFTAISSSRCSTPITTSVASCRSTSMTRRRAGRSPCCCAPARRPRAPRSAVTCAVSSGASAGTGRRPGSPIHVYDTSTSRPVAVLLRPGKTPSGTEIRGHLRRLVRRLRRHWPQTRITIRGDGHYSRPEVMEWCDENEVDFVFGLPGNAVLDRAVDENADDIRTRRALDQKPCLRGFAETSYRAKSRNTDRRACARIEATTKGLDIRFVVTSLETGSAEYLYETLYCARGQAENLIKLHKAQLASDRTSCRSPLANQMRLILHTAAYWLM